MTALIGFLKHKLVIQLVGAASLCAVIWFVGPLISFGGKAPLGPELNRLIAILVVILVMTVYNLFKQARANRTDQRLIAELSESKPDSGQAATAEAKDEELSILSRDFEEALQLLKRTRSKSKRDRQYLYELPWYIIIGAPGSGKTTLLVNSGLQFPLTEHMGGKSPVQGVGGTRNCDWLFANEAIFLDTAGRYTTQDSHQAVDAAAWGGFLNLIKKYRPRRPINGVLVTMSMPDLLRQTDEDRTRHARAVRQRIMELYEVLGIQFPIYMLFTKCDLVAGFTEFFADMREEEREQVWGETFPGDDAKETDTHIAGFDGNFEELLHRLNQRTFMRIQEERDIQRRSLTLDFPQQIAMLKPAMIHFLRETFGISRYEDATLLRGVYFTSGTQEGTPIDRIMGHLASTYGLDRQNLPVFSGRGKSYFITRLLKEVVIPEGELAGVNPRVERRRSRLHWAAYACLLVLTVGMFGLWSVSYTRNKQTIEQLEEQIEQYQTARKDATDWQSGVKNLLARLNVLQSAHDVYTGHPWSMGFGLYQGDKLRSGINYAYEASLKNSYLPLIKARLEQHMVESLQGRAALDLEILYELLKVYLMLGLPEKMDIGLAEAWMRNIWEQDFPREPKIQAQLLTHSGNLLKLTFEPIRLDQKLIFNARRKLNAQPLSLRVYADLKNRDLPDRYNFRLQEALGPYGDQVFTTANGQAIQTLMVPGLYSYEGYNDFFRKQGLDEINRIRAENWVLENPAAKDQAGDVHRLYDDLQKLYFAEYRRMWRTLLDNLRLKPVRGIHQTIQIITRLSGPETPLRPLLEAVEKNTSLSRDFAADTAGKKQPRRSAAELARSNMKARQSGTALGHVRRLERDFESLNFLVRSTGKSPPPLESVLTRLNEVRDFLMQIANAARSEDEALRIARQRMSSSGGGDVIKRAKLEFGRLPEPVRSWLLPLVSHGWRFTLNTAKSGLDDLWKKQILEPYKEGLEGRYPLSKNSRHNATMGDFSRFFAPNGIIEQFFNDYLKPFVDTTGPKWRQVSMDDSQMELSGHVLEQFQLAAKIRKTFFAAGDRTPSFQFELKPVYLDQNIATFRLNIEGQKAVYRHGPAQTKRFHWPGPQSNAGVRLTFQTLDGRQLSLSEDGPWALLKILDKATVEATPLADRFMVTFQIQRFKARYELRADSVYNPFRLVELQNFRCPDSL